MQHLPSHPYIYTPGYPEPDPPADAPAFPKNIRIRSPWSATRGVLSVSAPWLPLNTTYCMHAGYDEGPEASVMGALA
jgi:hypothetical protein